MKIHTFERAFVATAAIVLVGCMIAIAYASLGLGMHLPGRDGEIDPQRVRTTPPFDQLGVRQVGPNQYQAVMIGQAWTFVPAEIRIPRGADVEFIATSTDVIHGFHVGGTRLNIMLIPGQISRYPYRFDRPGEYVLICHEYCGLGHHTMFGRVIVE